VEGGFIDMAADGGPAGAGHLASLGGDRRALIARTLAGAAERGELCLQYLPQIDLHTGKMYGAEALLRWNSPLLGRLQPADFLPVAESNGLIAQIGDWALHRACEQAVAWRREGLASLRVSVNIAALQLGDLAERVQSALLAAGASPAMLGIEVTETMLSLDTARAAKALHALRAIGVQISLDDFGTGYSNLGVLRSLPI